MGMTWVDELKKNPNPNICSKSLTPDRQNVIRVAKHIEKNEHYSLCNGQTIPGVSFYCFCWSGSGWLCSRTDVIVALIGPDDFSSTIYMPIKWRHMGAGRIGLVGGLMDII